MSRSRGQMRKGGYRRASSTSASTNRAASSGRRPPGCWWRSAWRPSALGPCFRFLSCFDGRCFLRRLVERLQRSIFWSLVLGICWHMIHILVSIMHFGSYLIQLLHCLLISSGVLRKYRILPLHGLQYLAIVIDSEEAEDTLKIKKLLRWLSNIGMKHVILYDFEGVLKRSEAGLRKWTCSSTRHCECDIHTLSPFVDPEKMTLEVLSSYDGKEAVVNAANFLCSKHLKENNVVGDQRELVFTEADMADALTTVGCGGPEPGLLLVFSPVRCHWGFPAWRMRYTEIVHMGSLKYMKYGAVIKAIYDLSRKHQNFGS